MTSKSRQSAWVVIIVMIGLLGLTAATIASDIDWPWSSEPGTVFSAPGEKAQIDEVKLQPDDNGYTGPAPKAVGEVLMPSAEGQDQTVNWDALIPESAPDRKSTDADLNWSGFHYYNVTGSALRPRDSSVEWASDSTGRCLYMTAGDNSRIFNLHLDIPHGARIDYLRLFYYDTSSDNSTAWVTRYDDVGGVQDLSFVSSADTTGYDTAVSSLIEHVVDNLYYSYLLNWRPNETGSIMMLCGLRIAYRLP